MSHPTDRRAHHLMPTEAAVRHVETALGEHHSTLVAEINKLGDEQAATTALALSRIADALDALADN
jgi:DNA-binding MarR family transcriptional regulator